MLEAFWESRFHMNAILRRIAHWCLPSFVHRFLYIRLIRNYYQKVGMDDEINGLLGALSKVGPQTFLYPWVNDHSESDIEVFFDESVKLHYVLLGVNRLYYPRNWDVGAIRTSFFNLQYVEQHPSSPHRYLTDDFNVNSTDCVVDCGAAEGIFGLSVVERVGHLYLFEADVQWMEALAATFAPWKEKVEIVQKYVSNENTEDVVSLDAFFTNKEPPTFLKLDVEGCEEKVLLGARRLLTLSVKKVSVCAYHCADDEIKLTNLMSSFSFAVMPAPGYMFFQLHDDKPPYFRRGVLRCECTR